MNTWLIVGLAVTVILGGILVLRLHAFLSLLFAAFLVACLSSGSTVQEYVESEVAAERMLPAVGLQLQQQTPTTRLTDAFAKTVGSVGILIALASVIGSMLSHSGAAHRIITTAISAVGVQGTPLALAAGSFILGIPVFFDTVFYLMVPLARSAYESIGKNYTLLVLSILAGGSLAHSLVPPTPGPLLIAEILDVPVARMMAMGFLVALLGGGFSLLAAGVINRLSPLVPDAASAVDAASKADAASNTENCPNDDGVARRPALWLSLLPIVLPVLLIVGGSFVDKIDAESSRLEVVMSTLCNKNVALGLGTLVCVPLIGFVSAGQRKQLVADALAAAGGIILITAAGGALGKMLAQAGVAAAVEDLTVDVGGLGILVVAFVVTAAIRTLQGSATVAMITAAGILQGMSESLPFDPVYLALAIGAGSKPISWMTDSAFWVITKMSGMSEQDGLRTITPMSISMGLAALMITMIAASIAPFMG